MKILMIITGLGMGGAEHQVCNLADKLTSLGHTVKIAYLLRPAIVKPKSEKIDLIWLGGGKSLLSIFSAFFCLVKIIKKYKPDIVHSHMFHSNILSRLARIFSFIPRLVNTSHNTNEGGKLRMLAYRATDRLSDVFTSVSLEGVQAFEKKKASFIGKMIFVHNGINTDHFKFKLDSRNNIRKEYNLEKEIVFIAIGRFHEQKDYSNLINAFYQLQINQPQIHLLIVGDGVLRTSIENMIIDKKLTEKITLLGIRDDIPDLLSAADVFVLSSAWEGFGLVVAEAMACERTVVATDCGGVSEVVGEAGFLVSPKDSNKLALALGQALHLNAEERKNLGKMARFRVIQYYGLEAATEKWLSVYSARS